MGVVITVTVNGINEVIAKLDRVSERSQDLTIPMKQGAILMLGSVAQNFQVGGRPVNWVPLAPSTVKYKIRQGLSMTPLTGRSTHGLKASIVPEVDRMGFKLGTSKVYARIHQRGGLTGRGHKSFIPARPYLVFQDRDIQQINQLIREYITKGT